MAEVFPIENTDLILHLLLLAPLPSKTVLGTSELKTAILLWGNDESQYLGAVDILARVDQGRDAR
jgi:hypothetical protein